MNAGYTYTSIIGGPGEPPRIEVSFYLDDAARIRVFGVDIDRPQLNIAHGDVQVTFLPSRDRVTADDARIARDLASKAAIYAAGVEQLRAEHAARTASDPAA